MERGDLDALPGITKLGLAPSPAPHTQREFWSTRQFIAVTQSTGGPEVEVMFGAPSRDALSAVGELVDDPYSAGLW